MKVFKTLLLLLLPFAVIAENLDERAADSRQITQRFGGQLKAELKSAMTTGGPLKAMAVCNTEAPGIAKTVANESNSQVRRTSLKVRNPGNAPDEWERAVLTRFELQKSQGADVRKLEFYEVTDADGASQFRYMKAIPTGQLCTTCHGTNIAPPIERKIAELYPKDQARGFAVGDIRGAFSITQTIQP